MCKLWATFQLPIRVEKISYKHPQSLRESIYITFIENDIVFFEYINYRQTDRPTSIFIHIKYNIYLGIPK